MNLKTVAHKAIADYKKVSTSDTGLADIMLTYVEAGIVFTATFGEIDEPFYYSMEGMYSKACQFIKRKDLFYEFEDRLKQCLKDTYHMGGGFYDQLSYLYDTHFGNLQT